MDFDFKFDLATQLLIFTVIVIFILFLIHFFSPQNVPVIETPKPTIEPEKETWFQRN
jgi:hypothetical protein